MSLTARKILCAADLAAVLARRCSLYGRPESARTLRLVVRCLRRSLDSDGRLVDSFLFSRLVSLSHELVAQGDSLTAAEVSFLALGLAEDLPG